MVGGGAARAMGEAAKLPPLLSPSAGRHLLLVRLQPLPNRGLAVALQIPRAGRKQPGPAKRREASARVALRAPTH